MSEVEFIQCALKNVSEVWSTININRLANFDVPHNLLGRRRNLLKGDINELWAQWFVESLADPRRIAVGRNAYPFLFEKILKAVEDRFRAEKTRSEIKQIASVVANIILGVSNSDSSRRRRRKITFEQKKILLEISGSPPRCWICGATFKSEAIDNYFGYPKQNIELPLFVDILKPRGLVKEDFRIEVEHQVPFSKGGGDGDNLALACGWCNRYKRDYMSIYDVEGIPRKVNYISLGIESLPHPFWVIRLLAIVKKCENPEGCDRSVQNSEMTVAPIHEGGALNPTNLRVICYDHDPLKRNRLLAPSIVKRIWNL